MKKILSICLILFLTVTTFTACSSKDNTDNGKIKVVTTIFPQYDFAKKIGGDKVDVKMLLKPGAESHTYEPTPDDIKDIENSDLFIYTGGENDHWIEEVLESASKKDSKLEEIKLLDIVKTLDEETVEGMEEEEHDHDHDKDEDHDKDDKHDDYDEDSDHEIDEHVWTSPKNAIIIAEKIKDELIEKDKDNKSFYEKNFEELKKELESLDNDFSEVVKNGKRKTILFGDRFPFRYFANEYGLTYYAAFSGCSTDSEADAKTISFLIDKVKKEKLPVVFTIELSSEKIGDTIAEATGAEKLVFHSCHNLSKEDYEKGISYVEIMRKNLENLKKALN